MTKPAIAYRAIRSRRRFSQLAEIRHSLEKVMKNEAEPSLLKLYEKRVANWEHKPEFHATSTSTSNDLSITVGPVGPNANLWIWISGGTNPHTIRPRTAPFLAFQTGSRRPKTRPGNVYGGPGDIQNAQWVYAKEVHHPGIEAREFEKHIRSEFKPEFSRIMENGWMRIIRSI